MSDHPRPRAVTARDFLPSGAEARRLLEARAAELREEPELETTASDGTLFLRCATGTLERFGLPLETLDEILYCRGLRAVPGTPPHVAGVINRRGELLAVIDINPLFGLAPQRPQEGSRIVVVHAGGITAGLLMERLEEEEPYTREALEPPFHTATLSNTAHILGLHQGRVTLLDVEALLGDPQVQVNDSLS